MKTVNRRTASGLMAISLLTGCMSAIKGGPPSVLNEEFTNSKYSTSTARDLYDAGGEVDRNRIINQRLMMIDQAYVAYVRSLNSSVTASNVITDLGNLAFGLSGTLTNSSGALTNWAAATTLLNGTQSTISRRTLFEQSTSALTSAMDAARAEVKLRILESSKQTLALYPAQQAYEDLLAYEFAGTLTGGLSYVKVHSDNEAARTQEDIRSVVRETYVLSPTQRATKRCLTHSLSPSNRLRSEESLTNAARSLGIATDKKTPDQLATDLQGRIRDAKSTDLEPLQTAFKAANLLNECKE